MYVYRRINKTLKSLDRLPKAFVTVDLVRDKVRNRLLTLLVAGFVFSFLVATILPQVFARPSSFMGPRTPADIQEYAVTGTASYEVFSGGSLPRTAIIQASNIRGYPVPGATINATSYSPNSRWNVDFRVKADSLSGSVRAPQEEIGLGGLVMTRFCDSQYESTLEQLSIAHSCVIDLENDIVDTDRDGFANFTTLKPVGGVLIPEEHVIDFSCSEADYWVNDNPARLYFTVFTNVSGIRIIDPIIPPVTWTYIDDSYLVRVQVWDSAGMPLEGRIVYAITYSPSARTEQLQERVFTFGGRRSLLQFSQVASNKTDSLGVAEFDAFEIHGATERFGYIDFVCEGQLVQWRREKDFPVMIVPPSNVARYNLSFPGAHNAGYDPESYAEFDALQSFFYNDGQQEQQCLEIYVSDLLGNDVPADLSVYARISKYPDILGDPMSESTMIESLVSYQCPYIDTSMCTTLQNPIGEPYPSDAVQTHIFRFCDLRFSRGGSYGIYDITFTTLFAFEEQVWKVYLNPVADSLSLYPTQDVYDNDYNSAPIPLGYKMADIPNFQMVFTLQCFVQNVDAAQIDQRWAKVEFDWTDYPADHCQFDIFNPYSKFGGSQATFPQLKFFLKDEREECRVNVTYPNYVELPLLFSADSKTSNITIRVQYPQYQSNWGPGKYVDIVIDYDPDIVSFPDVFFVNETFASDVQLKFKNADGTPVNITNFGYDLDPSPECNLYQLDVRGESLYEGEETEGFEAHNVRVYRREESGPRTHTQSVVIDCPMAISFRGFYTDPSPYPTDLSNTIYSRPFYFTLASPVSLEDPTVFGITFDPLTDMDSGFQITVPGIAKKYDYSGDVTALPCSLKIVAYPEYMQSESFGIDDIDISDVFDGIESCVWLDSSTLQWTGIKPNIIYPGDYVFVAEAGGAISNPFYVSVLNPVSSMTALSWGEADELQIAESFGVLPRLQILDSDANPVEKVSVFAYVAHQDPETPWANARLAYAHSRGSDASGIVEWDDLSFQQGSSGYQTLGFSVGYGTAYEVTMDVDASFDTWKLENSIRILMTQYASLVATPNSAFATQPKAYAFTFIDSVISTSLFSAYRFPVTTHVIESTVSGHARAGLKNNVAYTTSLGNIVFTDLQFTRPALDGSGYYIVGLFLAGKQLAEFPIAYTTSASSVEIVNYPYIDDGLVVGREYYWSLIARSATGAPLVGEKVMAYFIQRPSNVRMVAGVQVQSITDSRGWAEIDVKLVKGEPGEFDLRFIVGSFVTNAITGNITNPVHRVFITNFDEGNVKNEYKLGDELSIEIEAVDIRGDPIQYADVEIDVDYKLPPLITLKYQVEDWSLRTDADGHAYMQIRFQGGSSGQISFQVSVMGIESNRTQWIVLRNQYEPNPFDISAYRSILYVCIPLIFPLFLANVVNDKLPRTKSRAVFYLTGDLLFVLVGFCFAWLYSSAFIGVLVSTINNDRAPRELRIPFTITAVHVCTIWAAIVLVIAILVLKILAVRFLYKNPYYELRHLTFYNRKVGNYRRSLEKMFHNMFGRANMMNKDLIYQVDQRLYQLELRPLLQRLLYLKRSSPTKLVFIWTKDVVWKALKKMFGYMISIWHFILFSLHLRKRRGYVLFPQRLLIGTLYGFGVIVLLAYGWFVISLWAGFGIDLLYTRFVGAQSAIEVALDTYYQAQASGDAIEEWTKVVRQYEQLDGYAGIASQYSSDMQLPESVIAVAEIVAGIRRSDFDLVKSAVIRSCYVASFGTMILFAFIFLYTLAVFRDTVIKLRASGGAPGHILSRKYQKKYLKTSKYAARGRYSVPKPPKRNLMDPFSHSVAAACFYIGMQVGHAVVGFISTSIVLFVLTFVFTWPVTLTLIYQLLLSIILTLVTGSFIANRGMKLFGKIYLTTTAGHIRHPRLFSLFDYVYIFLTPIHGVTSALIRLCLSIANNAINLVRLDRPLLHGNAIAFDEGFASWQAMLFLYERYDSRVTTVFNEVRLAFIFPS